MYPIIIALHNIVRWLALLAGFFALARAFRGWLGVRPWLGLDRLGGVIFSSLLDVQVLLGLVLYFFLSPITTVALRNFEFGRVMADSVARFYVVEHVGLMLLAVVFAHIGSIAAKKAVEPGQKHRRTALWFSLSLAAILAAIPWEAARLLPGF